MSPEPNARAYDWITAVTSSAAERTGVSTDDAGWRVSGDSPAETGGGAMGGTLTVVSAFCDGGVPDESARVGEGGTESRIATAGVVVTGAGRGGGCAGRRAALGADGPGVELSGRLTV